MRKISIAAVILIFTSGFVLYKIYFYKSINVDVKPDNEAVINDFEDKPTVYEVDNFKIIIKKVSGNTVEIIPNFNKNNTSDFIYKEYGCDTLINGGFYEKSGKPLGLYYLNGVFYGDTKNSVIYNGILALDKNSNWEIFYTKDLKIYDNFNFYMQSGPVIKYAGLNIDINTEDSNARRIIFAREVNNGYSVIILTGIDNFNDGPNFKQVSRIFDILEEKENIKIDYAINLDGGNSSLFIDKSYSLKESVFSGSFICFKAM